MATLVAGTCRSGLVRVGMDPPHLPKPFMRAVGEAERDFQESRGFPQSAQLVFSLCSLNTLVGAVPLYAQKSETLLTTCPPSVAPAL